MRRGGVRCGARLVGPVVAALLLAACGHAGQTALPGASSSAPATGSVPPTVSTAPASTGPAKSSIAWSVRGTGDPRKDAVLRAVQTYWSMVMRLAERPDPADAQLAAVTIDPQRTKLVTLFTSTQQQGLSQRGSVRATATVLGLVGGRARARACLDDRFLLVFDRAGKRRPGSTGGLDLFVLDLRASGGNWKVSNVQSPTGTCTVS